jgi:hypothetical protein
MGLSKFAPPSVSAPGVYSRCCRCSEELPSCAFPREGRGGASAPSARSCHAPDSFRPCRSSRLRRLAPPGTFQVCCTLKPIMGFAKFPASGSVAHLPSCTRLCLRRSRHRAPPLRSEEAAAWWRSWLVPVELRRAVVALPRLPEEALGLPWPFPLASHPSEPFPPQQLSCVNRSTLPRSACSFALGEPIASELTRRWPAL